MMTFIVENIGSFFLQNAYIFKVGMQGRENDFFTPPTSAFISIYGRIG